MNRQCPAARETTLYGYEGQAVALLLPFHGATVLAYEAGDTLAAAQPANFWSIRGDSVRLPQGLTFNSSWAEFRSAYGTRGAVAADSPNNDTEWVSFGFCSLPHLTFEFPLPAEEAITDSLNGDVPPESVPPHPHIAHVDLERDPESWLVDHCSAQALLHDLRDLSHYVGTFPCRNGLLKDRVLVGALRTALGNEFEAYRESVGRFLSCGGIEQRGEYFLLDVSQLHVGGYSSIILVRQTDGALFLYWLKATVGDKVQQVYGPRPIPADAMAIFEHDMNVGWGHVACFTAQGDSLLIDAHRGVDQDAGKCLPP